MKTERKRKPRVIWLYESNSGQLGRIACYYRRDVIANGKPVKFVEAL